MNTKQNAKIIQSNSPLLKAAIISIILALLKLSAFLFSGSLLVLGSFYDSLGDSFVSFLNYRVSKFAKSKPDKEHPFGHGGFEVASSLLQGFLLVIFAILLLSEILHKILDGDKNLALDAESLNIAIAVLLFSAFFGYAIQWFLGLQEKKLKQKGERSLSVSADRAHYMGDFWMNLGSALGLIVIKYTGYYSIDQILAFFIALLLLKTAYPIIEQSLKDVVHHEGDKEKRDEIKDIIFDVNKEILGVHRLRTRVLGPTIFIDFHMKLNSEMTLQKAHDIGDDVVAKIAQKIPHSDIIIHIDPDTEEDDELW